MVFVVPSFGVHEIAITVYLQFISYVDYFGPYFLVLSDVMVLTITIYAVRIEWKFSISGVRRD